MSKTTVVRVWVALAVSACIAAVAAVWVYRTPPTDPNALIIGVLAPFGTTPGEGVRNGVAMAVGEINARGGVSGKPLRIVEIDTAFSVDRAVQGYRRLAGAEGATAVIGLPEDGIFAVMEQLSAYRVPVLCTGNGADRLTDMVRESPERYGSFFRVMHRSSEIAAVTSDFISGMLHDRLGMKRFAIMTENGAWTESIRRAWTETVGKIPGASVVLSDGFSSETRDFSPLLNRIREAQADYILDASSRVDAAQYLKQWATLQGPPIGAIPTGAGTRRYYDQLGAAGIGVVSISSIPSKANPITSKSADWWERYLRAYGDPEYTSGYSYDAVYILKEALERGARPGSDPVGALEATDYTGVAGRWVFGPGHQPKYGDGYRTIPMIQYFEPGPEGYRVVWRDGKQHAPFVFPTWLKRAPQAQP
jgi:branched-chain amino acid transport system substrate-binding protein